MLTVAQALEKILEGATALAPQRLPLEQALGRTLAEDVVARESHPYFASSAMDGYAVAAEETAHG